jgi:HK97 family phage major capsid protein
LRRIPFRVPIGAQTSGGAGYWVGEGMAKPLTAFDFSRVTLEPLKVANIVVVTEELLRYAAIPAETLLRDQMVEALRARLDTDFIDPTKTAVPGTSPASVTNGATVVTSAGSSADAVRADVAALMQGFINANNNPAGSVWVMDTTTALRLSMMTGPLGEPQDFARGLSMAGGTFAGIPVIVSEYVGEFAGSPGAANVWLIKASEVALADEGGFNVDMSREASLVMDNAPVMSSGGIGSPDAPVPAQMVSMFQTNSVAFRAERTLNWQKLRPEAVQGISNVQWGA